MLYSAIAVALQNISQVPRGQKADLVASLLAGIEVGMLCPLVRLLLGELWPPWEEREMGTGPKALMAALTEVSEEDVPSLEGGLIEMGAVAEAAMLRKGQHPLSGDPLQALSVYKRLRRISRMRGLDSEHRKNAVLRGLFLECFASGGKVHCPHGSMQYVGRHRTKDYDIRHISGLSLSSFGGSKGL